MGTSSEWLGKKAISDDARKAPEISPDMMRKACRSNGGSGIRLKDTIGQPIEKSSSI